MPGPNHLPDPSNMPRPIMLIARPEHDGTLTLVLDAAGSDTVPTILGGGYQDFDQVKDAVIASLTAPAVAEDRMAPIEDALPLINQLIDAVNDLTGQVSALVQRVEYLEQMTGRAGIPQTRPLIPRLGERQPAPLRQPRNPELTRRMPGLPEEFFPPQGRPPNRPYVAEPPRQPERPPIERTRNLVVPEGSRPDFERGNFQPHEPVGRVARGPGTPD